MLWARIKREGSSPWEALSGRVGDGVSLVTRRGAKAKLFAHRGPSGLSEFVVCMGVDKSTAVHGHIMEGKVINWRGCFMFCG